MAYNVAARRKPHTGAVENLEVLSSRWAVRTSLPPSVSPSATANGTLRLRSTGEASEDATRPQISHGGGGFPLSARSANLPHDARESFRVPGLTFPCSEYIPSLLSQSLTRLPISPYVAGKLLTPKWLVRSRQLGLPAACVLMPEAAVHKDYRSVLRKNDVRSARKTPQV